MVWQRPHFTSAAGYSIASIKIRRREADNRCSVIFANYFTEFMSLPLLYSPPKTFRPPTVRMPHIDDIDTSVSVIGRILSKVVTYYSSRTLGQAACLASLSSVVEDIV
jgi:hypothetical protein